MSNDLSLTPEDLAHLPGAPFTQEQVDAALAALRRAAGWHVAPVRTETVQFDIRHCWSYIQLPTLQLQSVNEIIEVDAGEVVAPVEYRVSHKLCTIKRECRPWPHGYETVAVDFTHGYAELPPELIPVLGYAANLAGRDQGVSQVRIDDFSQSFGTASTVATNPLSNSAILADYSLSGGRSLYGIGIA